MASNHIRVRCKKCNAGTLAYLETGHQTMIEAAKLWNSRHKDKQIQLDAMREGMRRQWRGIRNQYVEMVRSGTPSKKAFDIVMMGAASAAEELSDKDL